MTPDISSDPQRARQRLQWARDALNDATATLERASVDAGFRSYWRSHGTGRSRTKRLIGAAHQFSCNIVSSSSV